MQSVTMILLVLSLLSTQVTFVEQSGVYPINVENAAQVEASGTLGFGILADAAWSHDGQTVAVASSTGISFYDSDEFDRAPYERWEVPGEIPGAVAFSPNDQWVATFHTGSYLEVTQRAHLRLWDYATGQIIFELPVAITIYLPELRFTDDSRQLILYQTLHAIAPVVGLDLTDIEAVRVLSAPFNTDLLLALTPDNEASDVGYLSEVELLKFNPEHSLVTGVRDDRVSIWDLSSGEAIFSVTQAMLANDPEFLPRIRRLEFSPLSNLLYIYVAFEGQCGDGIEIWNIAAREEVASIFNCLGEGGFYLSPDESVVLIDHPFYLGLEAVDTQTGQREMVLGTRSTGAGSLDNHVRSVAFSSDGKLLYAVRAGAIDVWDVGRQVRVTSIHVQEAFNVMAFNTQMDMIAAASLNTVYLYNDVTSDPQGHFTLLEDIGWIAAMMFSPDGNWLFVLSSVGDFAERAALITIWDVQAIVEGQAAAADTVIAQFTAGRWYPYIHFALDAEGQQLAMVEATADGERMAMIYNVEAILSNHEGVRHNEAPVIAQFSVEDGYAVAFSSDGSHLVVDNTVYSTVNWEIQCHLEGHVGVITDVAFTSDGSVIVTGSGSDPGWFGGNAPVPDNTVRLWDTESCVMLKILTGHLEGIWDIALSPDDRYIVSGSGTFLSTDLSVDGTLRLWSVHND